MSAYNAEVVDSGAHNLAPTPQSSEGLATSASRSSGRSRAAVLRARRTNVPLAPPPSIQPRSRTWRRWNDLADHYSALLGNRVQSEATLSILYQLLWISHQLDQLRAEPGANLHTVMTMASQQQRLLKSLNLLPTNGAARPGLRDYLNGKNGAGP